MSITLRTILRHPIARIVIDLALCLGIGLLGMQGARLILGSISLPQSYKDPIAGTVFAIFVCAIYTRLFPHYRDRKGIGLTSRNLLRYLTGGILLGAGLASAVILIQYLSHVLTISAIRSFPPLLPDLWNTFVNSTIAEILIIGIFFRITEEWLGSWLALLILAVVFVILHITAPGATIISAIAVSTHAALLLGPAYIYTRSLWVPVAIHFAWDFSFAGLYGASVNGYTMDNSLLATGTNGPDLLTGGYFGPQGSIQAAALCLLTGATLLYFSRKHNAIIRPSFRKAR
ncbi:MAG TPA: CPBP family intramembrane glutamic endopeptidase [Puia sp.]|jgi:hypothetical protein|nr:CPBP family intramembrane glutamic endopeptidase [Puia sp.]